MIKSKNVPTFNRGPPPYIFFWGVEVSLTLTRIGLKKRALRFMEKQGHHAKAGIQAVTVVCLVLHDSDSFSFSIFGSIPTTFQRLGERKSPLHVNSSISEPIQNEPRVVKAEDPGRFSGNEVRRVCECNCSHLDVRGLAEPRARAPLLLLAAGSCTKARVQRKAK